MADVQAKIIVRVVDEATKGLQEIKKSIGGLDKTVRDHSAEFRKFGLAATAVGGAITAGLALAVREGREAIATEQQLNAVLKSTKGVAGLTADELKRMAQEFARVTNYSDDAVLAGTNVLLTYTGIAKDTFPRAQEATLDMAEALGLNLTSASERVGNALQYPSLAINSLTKQGFRFTEEQVNMIKAMEEAGNMAGAQAIILEELELAYGGVARAVKDSSSQLKTSLGEVSEEIGKALIPSIDALAQAVIPVVTGVVEWMQRNPELTQTIVAVVAALAALVTVLGTLSLGLAGVTFALGVLGLSLAAGGALFIAIGGIIALVVVLIQHWEGLKFMMGQLADFVRDKFVVAMDFVMAKIQAVIDMAQKAMNVVNVISGGAIIDAAAQKVVGSIRGRANGGVVNEDVTLVGERGPELVSLPRGSRVHTANETRQMMGGVTIGAVHVHNEADEDRLISKLSRLIQLQQLQSA